MSLPHLPINSWCIQTRLRIAFHGLLMSTHMTQFIQHFHCFIVSCKCHILQQSQHT